MEKRDIRINYDMLETLLSRLEIYSKALDTMDKAMDKVNKAITENDSKSIRQLNKRYKKAKKRLIKSISEVYTLYESLDNYVNDMTAIIKPLKGTTRVGRNDIYMNLQSMSFYMTEISALRTALLPETTETESMIEEDKQKMQRNYQKFHLEIQGTILQNLTEDMRDLEDTLKNDYYKKKVVKYENKDDEHRWRTEAIRQFLSSPLDRIKQNAIDWENFVSDVKNSVKMAVVSLIEGLASLMVIVYYGWRADVALLAEATATDPPDWVDDALRDYDEYVYPLTEILTGPVAVVESLAQTASDTYEKEGLTYMVSYAVTDLLIGKALSGAGKADDVTDVANVANKADDVADVADDIKRYDDLDDLYGKKSKKKSYSTHSKKISRKIKKKYIEMIDDLVNRMKEDNIPKDISYKELVAKYGDEYYVKELKAAYSKYTGKSDQLDGIDYRKILEQDGRPVKKGEHAHHIVYKKGLPGRMREIAEKAQDILRKYDIDPATDPHNLVSAPNKGHSIENIKEVYKGLTKAEKEALEYCKKKGYNAKKTKQVVKQWLYDELDRLGNIASKAGR